MRPLSVVICLLALSAFPGSAEESGSSDDLAGLWGVKRTFGPEIQGTLELTERDGSWRAEIAGQTLEAAVEEGEITFEVPGSRGSFAGRLSRRGGAVEGHWTQPPITHNGLEHVSPVLREHVGKARWRGRVVPLEDEFTVFLLARPRPDGKLGAFLRNPDRNIGIFWNLDRLEREDDTVNLIGTFFRNTEEVLLTRARYDPNWDRLSVYIHNRGGTFDLARLDDEPTSNFYARGKNPGPYRYLPPPTTGDGWSTAALDDVGISLDPIKQLIETIIDPPAEDVHAPYIHGLLIARHGKLDEPAL